MDTLLFFLLYTFCLALLSSTRSRFLQFNSRASNGLDGTPGCGSFAHQEMYLLVIQKSPAFLLSAFSGKPTILILFWCVRFSRLSTFCCHRAVCFSTTVAFLATEINSSSNADILFSASATHPGCYAHLVWEALHPPSVPPFCLFLHFMSKIA